MSSKYLNLYTNPSASANPSLFTLCRLFLLLPRLCLRLLCLLFITTVGVVNIRRALLRGRASFRTNSGAALSNLQGAAVCVVVSCGGGSCEDGGEEEGE